MLLPIGFKFAVRRSSAPLPAKRPISCERESEISIHNHIINVYIMLILSLMLILFIVLFVLFMYNLKLLFLVFLSSVFDHDFLIAFICIVSCNKLCLGITTTDKNVLTCLKCSFFIYILLLILIRILCLY